MKRYEDWNQNPDIINIILRALVVTIAFFGIAFMQTGRFEFITSIVFFVIMFVLISVVANGINNVVSVIFSIGLIIAGTYSNYLSQQRALELFAGVPILPLYKLILFPLSCIIIIVLINHIFEKEL